MTPRQDSPFLRQQWRAAVGIAAALAGQGLLTTSCKISEYTLTGSDSDSTGIDSDDAPCDNGIREPWESDIDCGGPICVPCGLDQACKVDSDCDSAICANGFCSDNACEQANACPLIAAPCLQSRCDFELGCVLEPVPDGSPCNDTDSLDPPPGTCLGGLCTLPCGPCDEEFSGPCRLGICDPLSGECAVIWAQEGEFCDLPGDMGVGICFEGSCAPPGPASLLFADFGDPNSGWQADDPWQIGSAIGSSCSDSKIEDPTMDADFDEGGQLAGLLIGDCLPAEPVDKACITSPPIQLPFAAALTLRYWEVVDLVPETTFGNVEILDGMSWIEVAQAAPQAPLWSEQMIPLEPLQNSETQLRFCFESTGEASSYSGWSIDNIELVCTNCRP